MIPPPTEFPRATMDRLGDRAAEEVAVAATLDSATSDERRRAARLAVMRATHADATTGDGAGLAPHQRGPMADGLGILIDAAEDTAHGAVGELTQAGIAAAKARKGCDCGPIFLGFLRTVLDAVVSGASSVIRSGLGR